MKKVIDGKRYDTNTAKRMAADCYEGSATDFQYWTETLYRKTTGEYFLHGEGGPMSRYAVSCGQNSWSGGEKIIPLTIESAKKWAEDHLNADEYEEIFGAVEETATKRTVTFSLSESAIEKIKRGAAESGIPMSEYIESLLS